MRKAASLFAVLPALLLILIAAATAADKTQKPTEITLYGTVSCSIPPAPPPPPVAPPDPTKPPAPPVPDTVDLCLARHGKVVLVDDVTKNQTPIQNPDPVKGYEGRRISTSGYMNDVDQSFHVISVRRI
jgi:hypothetical protein